MRNFAKLLMVFLTLGNLTAADEAVHEELRTLRLEIINAITKGDIDNVIKHVHPDVVITWQNSEVCRGQQGLKNFFQRMGKDSFKGYKVPPTPDELTILHGGNTGISFGETIAEYRLLGNGYELKSRWTATLVKENGKWLLAAYHISMNVLDNPILTTASRGLYLGAAVALVIGILIGRMLGRRRAT